ncbi:FAD-dependent oxidoreductase [Alteromonas sp. 345S023]|uniref:FAD-dependent oxidoreductase n=1 Tax=Alteromonas profundi TaxID=2696062 RepID=A0A7X5RJU4_9ALTE|nr:FAD-dependent oxidoreductase [Alteromonas profundi]NDV90288.1 FAD-dependent oxidoreductase [Alteromonas profundi]
MYAPLISTSVTPTDKSPASYWHATHQSESFPSLSLNIDTEYLIIGGGYTGLSAAIALAEAKKNVTLLDANNIGFGCAGRNAGFVLSGSGRLSLAAIEKNFSKRIALGMQREFDDSVALLHQRISQYAMNVDLTKGPYIKLAHNKAQANNLRQNAIRQNLHFGSSIQLLSKSDIDARLDIRGIFGAVETQGACLHPLKLADEYARISTQLGASLYCNTPVSAIVKHHDGYKIATTKGTVFAQNVIIASNAYTPKIFHKAVDNRQFPVQSSILVTPPLTPEQQKLTGLTSPMSFMDTRMMKYYYRVLPDGWLLFGGRGAVRGENANSKTNQQRLYHAMATMFPALKPLGIDYFWSGWVSVSLDSMPRIFTHDEGRLGYAMGYCGSGVAFAAYAGQQLVKRMLDSDSVDTSLPLYQSPLPRYPFAACRRLALRGLYKWAKIAQA